MSNDNEILVKVDGVSKKFCRDLKKSLWYGMKDVASELLPFGKQKSGISDQESEETREAISSNSTSKIHHSKSSPALRPGEFWANKDISFELRRGECLGLIGHNGAGKTTLLKMLNGLIKPDEGTVEMRGRVGAMIALGAGFNPILTGRENIYVNGAVLGFTKSEIDEKIDSIVEFAEIDQFIDSPVQSYSSGMQVRLGFAVASSLDPDILIIDEVLAVGDVGFRTKCYNRIHKMCETSAVIFVSHSMPQIARLCSEALVLSRGEKIFLGATGPSIDRYNKLFSSNSGKWQVHADVNINKITVNGNGTDEIINMRGGEGIRIMADVVFPDYVKNIEASLTIHQPSLDSIMHINSMDQGLKLAVRSQTKISIDVPSLKLGSGVRLLTFTIRNSSNSEILVWASAVWELHIENNTFIPTPVYEIAEFTASHYES